MDRNLLNIFEKCKNNNEGYYNKFISKSGKRILILKYPYTNFQIKLVAKDRDVILEFYQSLGSFDCFNLIEELIEN